jgi:hypothetical protein
MKFEGENSPSEDTKLLPTEFASVGRPGEAAGGLT